MSSCPSPEPVPGSTGQGRQHASSTPRGPREGRASCSATRIKPSLGGGGAWESLAQLSRLDTSTAKNMIQVQLGRPSRTGYS